MSRVRPTDTSELLLGEWACLGILYRQPAHGFAVAARLRPTSDIGRIWSLSRPLTYRSLDQLVVRGLVVPVAEEPGIAGGNRTVLAVTRRGRALFRRWLHTPVEHVRDLRSELLLKITLAGQNGIDLTEMLGVQRSRIIELLAALDDPALTRCSEGLDVVGLWRRESAAGALRFLDRLVT